MRDVLDRFVTNQLGGGGELKCKQTHNLTKRKRCYLVNDRLSKQIKIFKKYILWYEETK